MKWDVVEVKPVAARVFKVWFADGLAGTIRIPVSFCTGVFRALLNDDVLMQAQVVHGAVTWPNGLDLAPDTMYREILANPERHYEVGSSALHFPA